MNENHCQDTLLLTTAARLCSSGIRDNRVPLFSSLTAGILCYGYAITNKLVNHDEVQSLFAKGGTVGSGRWGLGALDIIFPNYSMPLVNGLIAIVLMSVALCLMVHILNIHSKTLQALLCGSIMVFPSLIGTFAYMFTVNSFALSFLFAVLAVWFIVKSKLLWWIIAVGCMVFSLSIYQSYIAVAAGLLVLVLIRRLLGGEDLLPVIRKGIFYVVFLAVSLGIYYAATQVILVLKDISMNDYASGNVSFSITGIPAAVLTAYRSFIRFFSEGYRGLIPTVFSRLLHILLLAVTIALLVLRAVSAEKKEPARLLLLTALIGILPLASCCMYLFATEDSVHTLVLYGFVCFYCLSIIAADLCLDTAFFCSIRSVCSKAGTNLVSVLLALVIVCNVFLANQVWLNLQLRYENAFAFYTALLSDLRTLPEFTEDMPVAIIGSQQEPEFYETEFPFTGPITGTKGFKPDSYSREKFFTYYLGISLPFVSDDACAELAEHDQIQQMPCYPYYGSVQVIDGTIVVKLS